MDTYKTLRRLCTAWLLASIVSALLLALYGFSQLSARNSGGFTAFGMAALAVFVTYTFTEVLYLLIDIAISLRRIAKQGETPPTIRKLQKD